MKPSGQRQGSVGRFWRPSMVGWLMALALTGSAQALDVLLLSPQERAAVLKARTGVESVVSESDVSESRRYRLDGVLRRPEGPYWIVNGVPYKEGAILDDTGKRPRVVAGGVTIDGRMWRVGETYDALSGEILPSFSARIEIERLGGRR